MFRKFIYLASFVLLLGFATTSVTNAADANLVGWWKLDEGVGDTVADSSGRGHTGTFVEGQGAAPQWVKGMFGTALNFNGLNMVEIADHDDFHMQDAISIALWALPDGVQHNWAKLFCKNRNGGPGYPYAIQYENASPNVINGRLLISGAIIRSPQIPHFEGEWAHLCFTYDSSSGATIYKDGQEVGSNTNASGTIQQNDLSLCIGGRLDLPAESFKGMIDDVRLYNRALTAEEVQQVMEGMPNFAASGPSPANNATDVPRQVFLSWTPGEFADKHDVYFGTNFNDVNNASRANPLGVLASQGQSDSTYELTEVLNLGQTYYWRIDEVNAPPSSTIFKGDVWSFTAEPVAIPVPGDNITATASSENKANEGPENTINGSGLNNSDLHSIENTSMWLSSLTGPQPTWIQYEFDKVYKLHEMWVWNHNTMFESMLGFGVKDVTIEYSTNGADWTALGDVPEFARAPGTDGYAHNTTVDFGLTTAKYVRLTANSNWGGLFFQYGLSEVRFLSIPVLARKPSPDLGATDVGVDAILSFRAGREAARHDVYLSTDEQAVIDGTAPVATVTEPSYAVSLDLASTYYWRVDEVNDVETPSTWQGDIWNFTTQEYLVVDDFESYNDIPAEEEGSHYVYDTWSDGFGNAANGSTIGYNIPYQPTMETSTAYDGKQSVAFAYDNTTAMYSEVTAKVADLQAGQDWSKYGIKGLILRFFGDSNNTAQQFYLKLNGAKVLYDGDAGNLSLKGWQMWYIDLASLGVDLSNVATLSIGFERIGTLGGKGMVLLDGIRLYSYSRELITPAEPNQAGLVGYWQFERNTNDSAGANHGTATGDPTFVAGKLGQAIQFDGVDDYVDCGTGAALDIQDYITMSCWIKVEAFTKNWEAILAKGDDSYRISRSSTTGNSIHFGCNGTTGGNINATAIVADNTWHHVACVYDGANKIIYIDGREDLRAASTGQINLSTYPLWIGNNSGNTVRHLGGLVDDVRIYSRALSSAEVAWLAGRTKPFDRPF